MVSKADRKNKDEWTEEAGAAVDPLEAGQECLAAALDYQRLYDWSVTCCCPPDHGEMPERIQAWHCGDHEPCDSPGKAPWHRWAPCQEAAQGEGKVRAWWSSVPTGNVGIALGGPASGLVGVDIDGPDGEAELQRLSGGDLPETLEFTSGKGRRLLYTVPRDALYRTAHQGRKAKRPLSLLALGSQTVMPPSRHPTGRRYEWAEGRGPGDIDAAPARLWLLRALRVDRDPSDGGPGRGARPLADGEPIRLHFRNTRLTSLAGVMRRRGFTESAIHAALRAMHEELCDPPLPEAEVAKIARSIGRYDPVEETRLHFTDRGNAERLARAHGDGLRWVRAWNRWARFDGRRWSHAEIVEVRGLAAAMMREIYLWASDQARQLADSDMGEEECGRRLKTMQRLQTYAMKCESIRSLNAMTDLLRSEPGLILEHGQLDRHPWLLNCANGTLDLRTDQLADHRREDYLTMLCPTPYSPDAACPMWETFVSQVFKGDALLIGYVKRLLGYCLSGDVSSHMLPVFWGGGGNGKGTLLNTVLHVLGPDYATPAAADFLTVRQGERHPTEVANLFGRRLVSCQETGEGVGLNEPLVKWLTGADMLTARRMREDSWPFQPTHKLILSTNHRPVIKGGDEGIWRRLRLIPFVVNFRGEAEDRVLPERLKGEADGILAWLVRGCLEWQRDGECAPPTVLAATARYREEQDRVGQFIAERCAHDSSAVLRASVLYKAFLAWCEEQGEKWPMTQTAFGTRLTSKGVLPEKPGGVAHRRGLRLKGSHDSYDS